MEKAYNNIISLYNELQNEKVTRDQVIQIVGAAKDLGIDPIISRLQKLLIQNPESKGFHFTKVDQLDFYQSFEALGIPFISEDQEKKLCTTEEEGLGKRISNDDIYKMITNKFIKIIDENGVLPWSAGFNDSEDAGFTFANLPMNYESENYYRGINALVLSMYRYHTPETRGMISINSKGEIEEGITEMITDNRLFWLTFKQVTTAKGKITKGSLSQQAIYYNFVHTYKGKTITEKKYHQLKNTLSELDKVLLQRMGFLKYYNVFNERDITGIDFEAKRTALKSKSDVIKTEEKKILAADLVLKYMPKKPKFEIRHLNTKIESPHYNPNSDTVVMPLKTQSDKLEQWYGIAFHEFIHATGHEKRTNRRNIKGFERDGIKYGAQYALEELVAEIGSVFLNAESGIMLSNLKNNASYIKGWAAGVKKELQSDHKAIFKAAAQSQKAADYILDFDENGDPAYWKEYLEISKTIKEKGKKQSEDIKSLLDQLKPVATLTDKQIKQIGKEYASDILWNKDVVDYVGLVLAEKKKRVAEIKPTSLPKKFMESFYKFKNHIYTNIEGYLQDEAKQRRLNEKWQITDREDKQRTILDKEIEKIEASLTTTVNYLAKVIDEKTVDVVDLINMFESDKKRLNKEVKIIYDKLTETPTPTPPKKVRAKNEVKPSTKSKTTKTNSLPTKVVAKKPKVASETGQLALFGLKGTAKNKDTVAYNKEILKASNQGKIDSRKSLYLGNITGLLKKHIGGSKMYMNGSVIKKSMSKDTDHIAQWHHFINLPDYINNPLIIFRSKSKGFVIITELKNYKDKPLMVSIHFNKEMKATEIKSLYAKTSIELYQNWVADNRVIYANKKNGLVKRILAPIAKALTKPRSKDTKKSDPDKKGLNRVVKFEDEKVLPTRKKYDKTTIASLQNTFNVTKNHIRSALSGRYSSANALKIKNAYNQIINESKIIDPIIVKPQARKNVTPVNVITEDYTKNKTVNSNPLVSNIDHVEESKGNFIIGGDIGKFLGNIEIKPVGSVAGTIDAPQGAGKTRFFFQIMNELAKNYKVLFISLEEHPQSTLFKNKVKQYIDPQNLKNIDTIGELAKGKEKQILDSLIPNYDVVLVDSWNKIFEASKLDFDNDLRKAYNGKLIFAIFQRTVTGSMRGGAKAQFDGDIIMKVDKGDDFKNNIVYHDKNRYHNADLTQLHYNVYNQKLVSQAPNEPETQTPEPSNTNQPIIDKNPLLTWDDATVYINY